ncbi:DUF5597 domain-containing protein [Stakelama marina]|uniref:DUF5597 domain-containing protein n=1 Tax=Stakelama marina TaxID=2826939 RepID=A0A8T4IBT7_9SPHN|nr:DUF5597 domain-containing protein [Stakelama marina]MBR0552127.1 DUF5597 domain-containing protein [Stakelama marina]
MRLWGTALAAFGMMMCAAPANAQPPAPHLAARGKATQLVVDGRPFLILGGELANSSSSSRAYMDARWQKLADMHLNTVLLPVSWEQIESREGHFDFSLVDGLIADARAHDLHLVLLWFGTWKNSMSSYVPDWVKRDWRRFPRVHTPDGKPIEIISPFSDAAKKADAHAFAMLMRHLKAVDGDRHSVLMVQVENEVAMLPAAREHGPAADAAFARPVPQKLVDALASGAPGLGELRRRWRANGAKRAGDWETLFGAGDATDEAFIAWYLARYVDAVAAAGKVEYDLPFYVNAALNRPSKRPGEYPSGGPLPHLLGLWKAATPSIDLLAPDIYFPNFWELSGRYAAFNALFVPEAERASDSHVAANAWTAFGARDAIGYSPFSIDSVGGADAQRIADTYAVLGSLEPQILAAQSSGNIAGFAAPVSFDGSVDTTPREVVLGNYRFTVTMVDPFTAKDAQKPAEHGGIIIRTGDGAFIVAGSGITVTASPADGQGQAGIASAWEGSFVDGKWQPGRLLNGDETHQGRHIRLPPGKPMIQRVRYYRYR